MARTTSFPSRNSSLSVSILCLAFVLNSIVLGGVAAQAQTFTVLFSFNGGDGASPQAGLIMDAQGNLYGTTWAGGVGWGTVFKLDPSGKETVLHSFTDNFSDGASPFGSVIMDAAGNLYGTTYVGGGHGYGTVFKLEPSGTETVLHSFTDGADGSLPSGNLIMDADGNLYGVADYGGNSSCSNVGHPSGCGTVFKLAPSGTLTVLYSFTGGSDGADPSGGLIMDATGNLYGTTWGGGAYGYGTVFKLDSSGKETVLHSFQSSDGSGPSSGLIMDAKGNLYGTTYSGGAYGKGTVFRLDSLNNETVLYSFTGGSDGWNPFGGLVMDAKGNLYGTTWGGGAYGYGTVFKLDSSGKETVLHSFTYGAGGFSPFGVIQDAKGNLYGEAAAGGVIPCIGITSEGCGTVFEITKSATSTTLASSLNPSIYGQKVIFTAVVTTTGPLPPTGQIVFAWSGYTIGSATLNSSGIATLTKSNLNADPYRLIAVYKGDTNNLSSMSPVLNQTVLQTTSAATISSSLNPSAQGQAVTFTAKVTSPTVLPTGPVTFHAGTTVLGTVQLSGGKASYTTTSLPAGSTVIKVTYDGDSNIKGSSAAVTQVVEP
jgi:uncharacterized repeat protein (TIGR03803 family)